MCNTRRGLEEAGGGISAELELGFKDGGGRDLLLGPDVLGCFEER